MAASLSVTADPPFAAAARLFAAAAFLVVMAARLFAAAAFLIVMAGLDPAISRLDAPRRWPAQGRP
jgi:hypothetical protein